jgi:hypothetical protein
MHCVVRTLEAVLVASIVLSPAVAASGEHAHSAGPWPLVSLASLGTVTWRCALKGQPQLAPGLPALALGFRVARLGQTGHLALTIGTKTVVARAIQPGQVIALPYLHAPVQRLALSEGGEDGTLRATVVVAFPRHSLSNYCWPYMPPDVRVHLSPRR